MKIRPTGSGNFITSGTLEHLRERLHKRIDELQSCITDLQKRNTNISKLEEAVGDIYWRLDNLEKSND